ncbi:MAG: N-acetylmuramoyl-L-alanine amidase AmiC [Sediminibacterium sp.]|nr:N-acetylmuramoyl-L-alanine amidase AmiC [Sediminibacterium sp.]
MTWKNLLSSTLFIFLVITAQSQRSADSGRVLKQPLKRIVVDAGHGGSAAAAGKFYGASGSLAEEKDVALAIALQLQSQINEQMPDVEVIMTRTTDIFNSPIVKANKANAAKGDLFISIHCNDVSPIRNTEVVGYTTKTVKRKGKKTTRKIPKYRTWYTPNPAMGTETYIWGVGKTKDKEEALMENNFSDTSILVINTTDNPAMKMINSIRANEFAQRSRKLAENVEEEFVKAGRLSRGAKQRDEKGIWVLQAVAMPAILIEVGFLSNQGEQEFITSTVGQQQTAEAIVKAIKRYRSSLEAQRNASSN